MNETLIRNIVDMSTFAANSVDFSQLYEFDNGTRMAVSRNAMIGGNRAGFMGVLPIDKDGRELHDRAATWLSAFDVAQKMEILASE